MAVAKAHVWHLSELVVIEVDKHLHHHASEDEKDKHDSTNATGPSKQCLMVAILIYIERDWYAKLILRANRISDALETHFFFEL